MVNKSLPRFTIEDQILDAEGFTNSGKAHFKNILTSYINDLFTKSITHADVDRAENMDREVTHDHMKRAYVSLANRRMDIYSFWVVVVQIIEYVIMALIGVCGSNIASSWGYIGFPLGLFVLAMLILLRTKFIREQ